MSFKRGVVLIILPILLVSFVVALVLSLPYYLERKILPELFIDAGIEEYFLDVRRIGTHGVDIGRVTLGESKKPWLSIDSILVDYSLTGIMGREIKSVEVSGLTLEAHVQEGRIVIPDLAVAKQDSSSPEGTLPKQLPVKIGSLSVHNAKLTIIDNGMRLTVPFSLRVTENVEAINGNSVPVYNCEVELRPRGQLFRIGARVNLTDNMVEIGYAAESLHLDAFADLLGDVVPLALGGKATIIGTTSLQISPLLLLHVDADCKVSGARIASGTFSLRNRSSAGQPETPLHIQVNGKGEKMLVKVDELEAVTPYPVHIPTIVSSISYAASAVELDGNLQLEFADLPWVGEPEIITNPLREALDFNGSFNRNSRNWRLKITAPEDRQGRPVPQFKYHNDSLEVVSDSISLSVAAEGSGAKGNVEYSLLLAGLSVSSSGVDVKAPSVSLTGHTSIEDTAYTRAAIHLPGMTVTSGAMRAEGDITVAGTTQSASLETTPDFQPFGFLGTIEFLNVTAEEQEAGISINNMNAEIPFQWPAPAAADQGTVTIKDIRWQDKLLGPLTATVHQEGAGFAIDGVHENRLIPGISLHFTGQATYDGAEEGPAAAMLFETKSATDTVEADLGMVHPSLQEFSLRGGVGFSGESRWKRGTLQASVEVELQDARLWSTESDMTIDGINTEIAMVDLLELRSRPQQQFRFASASLGDLTVENGEIDFQIESKKSLLVEKSSFKWAGGSLYSHALRINPGVDNYRVIIFCDRLKLANLLEQFGAAQAEGEGAVSGRIPLVYADGRLTFGDGFLYSTPGEGGTIRITGGDAIAAGIPKNTPQFAQIDFAMEALKNFSYKWVKLQTVTEDDNLVVKMQLDGMPDRTLPFRYDSRIGEFTRIDLTTEQGILQPIRLDVNFRLPLNTLLDYSKGIGQLIDKMKE